MKITIKLFHASWCGPCHKMMEVLSKLKSMYPQVSFIDYDVDDNDAVVESMRIQQIPTTIIEVSDSGNDIEVARLTGLYPSEVIIKEINKYL